MYRGFFPGLKWLGLKLTIPSTAEVKNEQKSAFSFPYAFLASTGTNLDFKVIVRNSVTHTTKTDNLYSW
jgi:hypothetical protein